MANPERRTTSLQQLDFLHERRANRPVEIKHDGLFLKLIPDYLPSQESKDLLQALIRDTPWQQPKLKVYGKWHPTPRLVSFYGDPGLRYQYSRALHGTLNWTPKLLALKQSIAQNCQCNFNCVLLNHYRDGQDTMGWHADDEAELGDQPTIASLSLGAARDIHFKPRATKGEKFSLMLPAGSLLIMSGDTQKHWLHHVPKRARCTQARINLTFRNIEASDRLQDIAS